MEKSNIKEIITALGNVIIVCFLPFIVMYAAYFLADILAFEPATSVYFVWWTGLSVSLALAFFIIYKMVR